ncbi:TIR domain-containing protein [Pasteurella atlantica]|uniref:TIR domain-containing protein n=1 Tax=Pasteurellaceae TaxID=712 RepID=UPI0027431FB0|nr:TIR domain-containing protein [Pasteurella atlantica]MDP8100054.1 TIR domain-containing protein [Pasteurella atlantica]MDP8107964.1 TIR domain-containing protein [Pasteurella atlantica]MDP8117666.1 TIR domain-containing protein [Pasteurella atlantica]
MVRRVFFSFHYKNDVWRVSQIKLIGKIERNQPASPNEWEKIKGNKLQIEKWINNQIEGRSCTVVLIGSETANRPWVKYEIEKSWKKGMGVVGIYIHGLKDMFGNQSNKGNNPFEGYTLGNKNFSKVVKCYEPKGRTSQEKYAWIADNIGWIIEEAIQIRNEN